MATWDDVARICLALPETTEGTSRGWRQWQVRDKAFVWERPLGKKDVAELGDAAPAGPVVAAYVPDEGAKQALIAEEPDVYFTTSHFDGYPRCCAGWRSSTSSRSPSWPPRPGPAARRSACWPSTRSGRSRPALRRARARSARRRRPA